MQGGRDREIDPWSSQREAGFQQAWQPLVLKSTIHDSWREWDEDNFVETHPFLSSQNGLFYQPALGILDPKIILAS